MHHPHRYALSVPFALLFALLTSALLPAPTAAQTAPTLFEGGGAEPGQRATVVRTRTVTLDFSALERLVEDEGGALRLNLFDDVSVVAETDRLKRWSASQYGWFAHLTNSPLDEVTMEIDLHNQMAFATLTVDNRPYRVEQIQGQQYRISELDLSGLEDEFSDDGETSGGDGIRDAFRVGDAAKAGGETPSNVQPLTDLDVSAQGPSMNVREWARAASVVDILVLYTKQARDSAGTATQMEAEIRGAINEANRSFQKSGVNARLRLAASRLVTYPEQQQNGPSDILSDLKADANTSGDVAHRLRNSYGADIVALAVGDTRKGNVCGQGYVMQNVSSNHSNSAYFIIRQGSCMTSNRSFTHEAGHVMGARHDRYVDDKDGSPFDYNHGYVKIKADTSGPVGWRTIMAYNDKCEKEVSAKGTFCWRINRWSAPDSTRGGDAMGVASGDNAADNVRALNNTVATVASFKSPSPIVSGTVTDLITGSGLKDVEMRGALGPVTDSNGEYEMFVHWGTVQLWPDKGKYEFSPNAGIILNNVTSNRTQDFDAGIYHELAGLVYVGNNGHALSDVELKGAPGSPPPPKPNVGSYSFRILQGWTGTITPQSEKYTFSPSSRTYSGNGIVSDSTDEDFVASIRTYTISGQVEDSRGFAVHDVTMKGLPNDPKTDSFGYYSIDVEYGWSGTVTPTKNGYNFSPASRTYTDVKADHSDDYAAQKSALAGSKWPVAGGSAQRSGTATVSTVDNKMTWSSPVGGDATGPVVGSGDNIYVGSTDGALHAFDEHGNPLWSTKSIPGDTIYATPAAASGYRFYVPLDNGNLFAYDRNGASVWGRYLGGTLRSSPMVGPEGVVYVGSDNDSLYAVNPDGSVKWSAGTGDDVRSGPALGPNGTIYVGSDDGSLHAVRPDGTKKWSFGTGGAIRSTPAVDDAGTVYVGSDSDSLFAVSSAGARKWAVDLGGNVRSSPAIGADTMIYVGSADGSVYAVSTSGSVQWSYATNGPVLSSPAISQANVNSSGVPGEEVVYVGSDDSRVYALNTGSVSSGNRLRWSHRTRGPVRTSPALSDHGLFVGSTDDNLYNIDGARAGAQSGTGRAQIIAAAMAPSPEELYIVNRIANGEGGFGEPGWSDPGGCGGGPLVIPSCGGPGARFGGATGFKDIIAGESLRFGALAPWVMEEEGSLDRILSGETTEGLWGSFVRRLEPEKNYLTVLGGFASHESYPSNPNGRSTALNLFVKDGARVESTQPGKVQVIPGHFVPDGPALDLSLLNADHTFGTLKYGDFGSYQSLSPGLYTLVLQPSNPELMKRVESTRHTYTLDLRGKAGETVSLLATGTYEASDEPPLSIRAVGADGEMNDLRNLEGTLAPGVSSLPGLFEDDLLLEPAEQQSVTFEPRTTVGGLSGVPRDVLQLLPILSTATGHVTDALPAGSSYEIHASALSFVSDAEQTTLTGVSPDEMPETMAALVESHANLEVTHLARLKVAKPDATYEFWLAMRNYDGYALPVVSLLRAEPLIETGERAEGVLTAYVPQELSLPQYPEMGQAFSAVFAVDLRINRSGGGYERLSEGPLYLGTTGEIGAVEQMAVGQAVGEPAVFERPIPLRLQQTVLGGDAQTHAVQTPTYVMLKRHEGRHELAATWTGTEDAEGNVTIQQGEVHSVGPPPGLQASSSLAVEADGRVDFGATGLDIAFEGIEGTGTVTVEKFDDGPSSYDGITSGNVSQYRFVVNAYETLQFGAGTLRLDVSSLGGIREPRTVTIYRRPTVGEGTFQPLRTSYSLELDELVATTEQFSEFVLASTSNALPVDLTSFDATTEDRAVHLEWRTSSETHNAGFRIQRRTPQSGSWTKVGFVEGAGTSSTPRTFELIDKGLPFAVESATYRLQQLDADGSTSAHNEATVSLPAPERLALHENFPNPFHRQTTVRYQLPTTAHVRLAVYDVLGRRVARLVDEQQQAGRKEIQFAPQSLPSGVYFVRLESDGKTRTQKITVVR